MSPPVGGPLRGRAARAASDLSGLPAACRVLDPRAIKAAAGRDLASGTVLSWPFGAAPKLPSRQQFAIYPRCSRT